MKSSKESQVLRKKMNERDILKLLMPDIYQRSRESLLNGNILSHYTSAEAAISIINKNEIWLCNAFTMNDSSELAYGHDCVIGILNEGGESSVLLRRLRDDFNGADTRLIKAYNDFRNKHLPETYLFSFSECLPEDEIESEYGRLSMWRAYGGDTNVALIFNSKALYSDKDSIDTPVSLLPVEYRPPTELRKHLITVFDAVASRLDDIFYSFEEDDALQKLARLICMLTLILKHPGFAEEREWRAVYLPSNWGSASEIKKEIESMNGVPQIVCKLPLGGKLESDHRPTLVDQGLKKILIGPTPFPYPLASALRVALIDSGVDFRQASQLIHASKIPLRR